MMSSDIEPATLLHRTPREPQGKPFHHLLYEGTAGLPRALAVIVAGLLALLVVTPLIAQMFLAASWFIAGKPGSFQTYTTDVANFTRPDSMLAAHLGLASLIIVVLVIMRGLGGLAPAWATSVQPGMRWRFLFLVAAPSLVILIAVVLLTESRGRLHPQPGWIWFLLIVLVTTPLQAAAEEYLFRGLLLQGLGACFRTPWPPVIISATLFALIHGVQNPALFVDRLAFGLLAGALVILTGGLEAAIAIHAANNVVAFVWAMLFASVSVARETTSVTWGACLRDVIVFTVVAALGWGIGRLLKVETLSPSHEDVSAPGLKPAKRP